MLLFIKKLFVVLSLIIVSGCATSEGYNRILNTWLNSDKQNLIETWGVPTSTYKLNEHVEYISYLKTSISYINGNIYNWKCETTFTIKDNKVTSWKYNGNSCEACNEGFWGSLCKIF